MERFDLIVYNMNMGIKDVFNQDRARAAERERQNTVNPYEAVMRERAASERAVQQ